MYFSYNGKYMNSEWNLSVNKEEALKIELIYLNKRLLRFKIGEQYLACLDKEPFLTNEKNDSTLFMVEKFDEYIYYVSIKYFCLYFKNEKLSSHEHSYINPCTCPNRISLQKLKYNPRFLIVS
jgi:hypothetical protein